MLEANNVRPATGRPLFLICNDDGIHAPGIRVLADAIKELGDVVVVAPHVERSATSQAISISLPLRVEEIAPNTFAVEGTPADCVMFAFRKILHRRPTWVLSGINRGGNLGHDTLYSGTVGAALEGVLQGSRAMAISCQGALPLRYDTAAQVVRLLLSNPQATELPSPGLLNINVPSLPFDELQGIALTSLGRRLYDEGFVEGIDPRGRPYFWLGGGGASYEEIPESDCLQLDKGFVTVSVLRPTLFDATQTEQLKKTLPASLAGAFKK